jgi:hypothetical protein
MIRLTKALDSTSFASDSKTRLGWDDSSINIDEVTSDYKILVLLL